MNSLQNLPIILCYEADGTISAHCPLLPDCQYKSPSRAQTLRAMQQLLKRAIAATSEPRTAQKYEVVHLAIAAASDSVNQFTKRSSHRTKKDSPLVELI